MRSGKRTAVDAFDRAQQGHLATGKLTSIDNQIDTTTGTVKLRAEFDNTDYTLFPNQFVNTRLLVKTLDNQVLIPSSAIQHNGSQDFVYVIQRTRRAKAVQQHGESRGSQTTARPRCRESRRATRWPTAALKSCRTARRSRVSKIKLPSASDSTVSTAP